MERLCVCGHPPRIHLVGMIGLGACVYDHGQCSCQQYREVVTTEQPVSALKNKFVLATSRLESEKKKTFYAKESLAAAKQYIEILERGLRQSQASLKERDVELANSKSVRKVEALHFSDLLQAARRREDVLNCENEALNNSCRKTEQERDALKERNQILVENIDTVFANLAASLKNSRARKEQIKHWRDENWQIKLASLSASVKELRVALKAMIDSATDNHCGLKIADDAYAKTSDCSHEMCRGAKECVLDDAS